MTNLDDLRRLSFLLYLLYMELLPLLLVENPFRLLLFWRPTEDASEEADGSTRGVALDNKSETVADR